MPDTRPARPIYAPNSTGPRLFGAPVGDFSVLQTLLITVAAGFCALFIATFVAIITIMVLKQAFNRNVDFAISYRWFGFPAGILSFVVTAIYLGSLLVTRLRRKAMGN